MLPAALLPRSNADTACAALLEWKPIRVPYQNHEEELESERADISESEAKLPACLADPKWCEDAKRAFLLPVLNPEVEHGAHFLILYYPF
jgi:hypothetical protein